MKLFAWAIIGLIAGFVAKAIYPGKHGGGLLATIALGIMGAVIGGFIGSLLFDITTSGSLSVAGLAFAIAGSILIMFLWGLLSDTNDDES
ncbi:MAG: GlsB/YeaQ/YmgE family stress response membrane protein [Chroococcales cyanobacterium]